jgi:transglutaminase-like putative cysteine protease
MLSQTKLASTMADASLRQIEALGDVREVGPGQLLFETREDADLDLHVVVRGDLRLRRSHGPRDVWLGPGDIVGEIGFVLGTPRTADVRAGDGGAAVWHVQRGRFLGQPPADRLALLSKLFLGLAPLVRVRYAKVVAERAAADAGVAREHNDPAHAAVRQMAAFLAGAEPWETAAAIFAFVRQIPYRIGFWQVKASRTLELGFGMCTTKSNLQVALLRASGIEAEFGEVRCDAGSMDPILPSGYRHLGRRKQHIKHYFAVARLGGRWIPMDATFPTAVWERLHPGAAPVTPERGEPVNPLGALHGDPLDFRRMPDLSEVMGKQPFFDADGVEAMNVVLDRLQGRVLPAPSWSSKIERLLDEDLRAAFLQSYAGLQADTHRLRAAIVDRPAPPVVAAEDRAYVV